MENIERTFNWTLSKVMGFVVLVMGFALELVLVVFKDQFDLKVFLGSVTAATVLVASKQINDTVRQSVAK